MTGRLVPLLLELKSLAGASALVVGARAAGGLIGLASQVVIARLAGSESLGIFFLALSVATVLSIFGTLGYPWIVARNVAYFAHGGASRGMEAFLAYVRRDIIIASTGLTVLSVTVAMVLPGFSAEGRAGLLIGVLTAPLFAFMRWNAALANAQKRFMLSYLPDLFWRPLLVFVLLVAMLQFLEQVSVPILLGGHLAIVLLLMMFQAARVAAPSGWIGSPHHPSDPSNGEQGQFGAPAAGRRHALPAIIATLFIYVFADLDVLIIGALMSEHDLAVFAVCLKIALFLAFAIQAVHQLILRDAADALNGRDWPFLQGVIARANLVTSTLSVAGLLIILVWGKPILGVFGAGFVEGHLCLVILATAQTVRALAGPAAQILTLTGRERHFLPVFLGALVLLAGCNLWLVPNLHLTGAAIAFLIVTVAWSGALAVIAWRHTGLKVFAISRTGERPERLFAAVSGNGRA